MELQNDFDSSIESKSNSVRSSSVSNTNYEESMRFWMLLSCKKGISGTILAFQSKESAITAKSRETDLT